MKFLNFVVVVHDSFYAIILAFGNVVMHLTYKFIVTHPYIHELTCELLITLESHSHPDFFRMFHIVYITRDVCATIIVSFC